MNCKTFKFTDPTQDEVDDIINAWLGNQQIILVTQSESINSGYHRLTVIIWYKC